MISINATVQSKCSKIPPSTHALIKQERQDDLRRATRKQERQDDLRRATRTIAKRVGECIEVDDGIFGHLL